jgi:hypothetical protein
MKAKFRITDPRLLLEASPGQLFALLGPELVECVCAISSHSTPDGIQPNLAPFARLNPDAMVPVVVIACRADPGDVGYLPAGYETALPGASPIVFLTAQAPLALVATEQRGEMEDLLTRHRTVLGYAESFDLTRMELASKL